VKSTEANSSQKADDQYVKLNCMSLRLSVDKFRPVVHLIISQTGMNPTRVQWGRR